MGNMPLEEKKQQHRIIKNTQSKRKYTMERKKQNKTEKNKSNKRKH